ncbi:BLUF domain-containing protein [Hymenobacter cavernae]|uniref:BLUF domain-containing protein n=1 Tax=Hymenobacter cavernae TaxID=2044852 RepID=A0ABQ1UDJ7_9BACT|nr:BLUF domain-containing protein [Hymenobacter cavernae]GGF15139.1 hypothetical protein GCM10011383_27990 [Hymenobacter cavernae]
MALHHIIYLSTAIRQMPDPDLQELLTQARSFNAAHDITGVLLYHKQNFVQVIEGDEAVVRPLYERIRQDARHTGVMKLADKELAHRSFGEWSMAFQPVDTSAMNTLAGFAHPEQLAQHIGTDEQGASLLAQIVHLTFHQDSELR